jgi:hypothetical protein
MKLIIHLYKIQPFLDAKILARILARIYGTKILCDYVDPRGILSGNEDPCWQQRTLLATRFLARNQAALAIVFH